MKAQKQSLTKLMMLVLALVWCGGPEVLQAQEPAASPQSAQQSGTTVDPSKGPLEPVPSQTLPNEPQPGPPAEMPPTPQPATPAPQPKAEQQMQEPLGAATAEGVPTVGGGASRPAGAAIAPAKQNQRRSLLLKLGAIAAVGIAGGTIYALSKGTSSHP
jgi:hypothetical protein